MIQISTWSVNGVISEQKKKFFYKFKFAQFTLNTEKPIEKNTKRENMLIF